MARHAVIDSLGEKIARLIEDNRRLRSEADGTTRQRDKLRSENRELRENVVRLEKRLGVLELGSSLSGGGVDAERARARINRLMREIDRCVALMNK